MQLFYDVTSLQKYLSTLTSPTAFIPTMGGLHEGHLSLITKAQMYAEIIIVSIFVNKTQFGAGEDYDAYPRTPKADIALLTEAGVDIVFLPTHEEIYPSDYVFSYDIGPLEHMLCGSSRPGHFQGVTRVVYRLFDIIKPTYGVFGQKDYQQLTIIKHMVSHFALDVKIIDAPTQRDDKGLALSTRNQYLTSHELILAQKLNTILHTITQYENIEEGQEDIKKLLTQSFDLDYCEVLNAQNLGKISPQSLQLVILAAVYIGKVRLIDNLIFTPQHLIKESHV